MRRSRQISSLSRAIWCSWPFLCALCPMRPLKVEIHRNTVSTDGFYLHKVHHWARFIPTIWFAQCCMMLGMWPSHRLTGGWEPSRFDNFTHLQMWDVWNKYMWRGAADSKRALAFCEYIWLANPKIWMSGKQTCLVNNVELGTAVRQLNLGSRPYLLISGGRKHKYRCKYNYRCKHKHRYRYRCTMKENVYSGTVEGRLGLELETVIFLWGDAFCFILNFPQFIWFSCISFNSFYFTASMKILKSKVDLS